MAQYIPRRKREFDPYNAAFMSGNVMAPDPTWSPATAVNTPAAVAAGPNMNAGPSLRDKREMVSADSPLYVTDDGQPVYLQDVIAIGGMGRLKLISRAARPIQEAFFKWVNRNKIARQAKGKPPMDATRRIATAGGAATAVGAGLGVGKYLAEQGLLPRLENVGGGRAQWTFPSDEQAAAGPEVVPEVTDEVVVDDAVVEDESVVREPGLPIDTGQRWDPGLGRPTHDPNAVDGKSVEEAPPEKREELERAWGKWTYSPRERRDKFMEQLNSIYMKAAWLDAIAAITGGTSKASQYIERASQKLEMMTKFDQEERLYKIWRDVYYDQDGNYDAPASKKEAAERARRLGASPEETNKIYGWAEEQADLVEWWRPAENEQGYETTTTHGKKERPPQGAGARWNMGSPPDRLVAPTAKTPPGYIAWTDGKTTVPVLKGQAGPAGFWPGTAGSTSGTHNERVEAKATEFLESDQDDARAIAVYENYYRSAKDQFGNLAFPDRLGAKQAAIEAVENLKIQLGMQPGTSSGGTSGPITEEQKAANANASDEEKIAKMTALRASGLEGEAVKRKMIEEGYVFD